MSNKPQKPIPPLPYPLSRKTRVAIMLTLLSVFLILTPVIVMYARGYTYDFKEKTLIHGGALSIETTPRDVTISMNGITLSTLPPVRLPNVLPGNYHIKIEKDGYFTWEKNISLVSNQTTYLHDIDLFPQQKPEMAITNANNIVRFFASPSANALLLLRKQGENFELSLYNPLLSQETFITKILSPKVPPQVEWSPSGELIRIESVRGNEKNIMLLNPLNPTLIQTNSTSSEANQIFQWEEGLLSTALLLQEGTQIQRIDLNSLRTVFDVTPSTTSWYAENQNILWQYADHTLSKYKNGVEVFSVPIKQSITSFLQTNQNRILATNGSNLVMMVLKEDGTVEENELPLSHISMVKDQDYYLAWQNGELWALSPEGTATLINRFSDDIMSVIPLTKSGTLLIATQNKLYTFHPRYYITHELVSAENIERVSVDTSSRQIFFLGTVEGKNAVWKLGY